ncbi:DoxX family protein [Sphingomonas faeni]|uniref:DoxX family protein n=1 Tax=Sphingomonas faeni TaxID=185950 RepID=UPI00336346A3
MTFWLDLGGVAARSDNQFLAQARPALSTATWTGRVLTAIVVVLLFADAVAQLVSLPMLRADVEATGFPFALSPVLGTITMTCVIFYANARTALLGAILLTGFLGGAICLHLRLGEIGSPPQIISLMLGIMTWGGLYLREPRLRTLLPLRA